MSDDGNNSPMDTNDNSDSGENSVSLIDIFFISSSSDGPFDGWSSLFSNDQFESVWIKVFWILMEYRR